MLRNTSASKTSKLKKSRDYWKVGLVALLTLFIGAGVSAVSIVIQGAKPCVKLQSNGKCKIGLEVVSDEVNLQLGLSGRTNLSANRGMLFVYPSDQELCFWMKDMKFSLDMVWLSSNKQIVAIEKNINPDSYPTTFCHTNAKYVLELNAGMAEKLDLHEQQTLFY